MLTQANFDFLVAMETAANVAQHVWPQAAACEAAVETGWGTSHLFREANNVFGEKQHVVPIYGTISFPTWEFISGEKLLVTAKFVSYPSIAASFQGRMATLQRLAAVYPEYAAALAATTVEAYVENVSKRWSTDPLRAKTVMQIYTHWQQSQAQQEDTQV
jgi:flagellum-specific peptidoglycan hydrolase FlgJ